ncbi:DUF7282 domain-containing protein [Haladaptatus caseinilyticus]|uniref:DUF7282 domain-containing protein n=1 Tax=Haladaptatus caseinilyticus TaxID=2993314 RepID=UPI00224ADC01|nr:hypothetical protein [Haladaptatus caseinilyticus]
MTSAVAGVAVATDHGANATAVSDTVAQSSDDSDWSDGNSDSGGNPDNKTSDDSNDSRTGDDCKDEILKASIAFDKQSTDGESVTVQKVTLKEKGYVVIYDENGNVVGQSEQLEAGTHADVTIKLNDEFCEDTKLKAVLYVDSNGNDDDADWSDGDSDSDGDDSDDDGDHPALNGDKAISGWACIIIE